MPSAISRPSEPVETVSTSIDLSFLPSRMIEPLPKLRSIWESAASRAFDLSMEEPSTSRNAVVIAPTPYRTGFGRPTTNGQRGSNVHDLFSVRNMFFSAGRYWPFPDTAGPTRQPVSFMAVGPRSDVLILN